MKTSVLRGPFLTRLEAARRAGSSEDLIARRPDLLRLGGRRLQEVYFAFQFDQSGIRPELARVVQSLKLEYDDIDICHWLVQPQESLGLATPLDWIASGRSPQAVTGCAARSGPAVLDAPPGPETVPTFEWQHHRPVSRHRPQHRRRLRRRTAAASGM